MKQFLIFILSLGLISTLGCGGGGGGGNPNPPNNPHNPPNGDGDNPPEIVYSTSELFQMSCKDPSDPNFEKQEDCICPNSEQTADKRDCLLVNHNHRIYEYDYAAIPTVDCTESNDLDVHRMDLVTSCSVEKIVPLVRDQETYQILSSFKYFSGLSLNECKDFRIAGAVFQKEIDLSDGTYPDYESAADESLVQISFNDGTHQNNKTFKKNNHGTLKSVCTPSTNAYVAKYYRQPELVCSNGYALNRNGDGSFECGAPTLTYDTVLTPSSIPACSGIESAFVSAQNCHEAGGPVDNSLCQANLPVTEKLIKSPVGQIELTEHPFSNLKNYEKVLYECAEGEKIPEDVDWVNVGKSTNPQSLSRPHKYDIVCKSGYHVETKDFKGADCFPNTRSCVASGQRNGIQSWNSGWGSCVALEGSDACNSGYDLVGSTCVAQEIPTPTLPSGSVGKKTELRVQPFNLLKLIYNPVDSSYENLYYVDRHTSSPDDVAIEKIPLAVFPVRVKKILSDDTDSKAYFLDHSKNLYRVSDVVSTLQSNPSSSLVSLASNVDKFVSSSKYYCYTSNVENEWTCRDHEETGSKVFSEYSKIVASRETSPLCGITLDSKARCWNSLEDEDGSPEEWEPLISSKVRPMFRHDRTAVTFGGPQPSYHKPDPDVKDIIYATNGSFVCAILANDDLRCISSLNTPFASRDGKVTVSGVQEFSVGHTGFNINLCLVLSDGTICSGSSYFLSNVGDSFGFKKVKDSNKRMTLVGRYLVSEDLEYYGIGKKLDGDDYPLYGSELNTYLTHRNIISYIYNPLSYYGDVLTMQENPNLVSAAGGVMSLFLNTNLGDYCGLKEKPDGLYMFCTYIQGIYEQKLPDQ